MGYSGTKESGIGPTDDDDKRFLHVSAETD